MVQPTPPGDIPLFDGLGSEWNDVVGALPEDRRSELAGSIKSRMDSYAPLKQWEELQKSGVDPQFVGTAIDLYRTIENNPRATYDAIGKYLGISPQEAQQVVQQIQEDDGEDEDPRDARMNRLQQQYDTMAQLMVAQRQQETQQKMVASEEAKLERELKALEAKHGAENVNQREIIMRMLQFDMTAEQAFEDFESLASGIRQRRPSPMVMSGSNGSSVPRQTIDPKTLSRADTKSLVVQMLQNGSNAANG